MNLLQTYRTCPKISTYAHLHGTYNFDTTPLAPPGVRALLYNDPNHRVSYGVHGDEEYYRNTALEHYRCYKCFVPSIGGIRICATAKLFPTDVASPMLSQNSKILVAANELVNALKQPLPLFTIFSSPDHLAALKKILLFFKQQHHHCPVTNTKILPQPAPVKLAPIHALQPPTQQFATYSTTVNPTPEPPDNADIPAPMTIPYNES